MSFNLVSYGSSFSSVFPPHPFAKMPLARRFFEFAAPVNDKICKSWPKLKRSLSTVTIDFEAQVVRDSASTRQRLFLPWQCWSSSLQMVMLRSRLRYSSALGGYLQWATVVYRQCMLIWLMGTPAECGFPLSYGLRSPPSVHISSTIRILVVQAMLLFGSEI